ncbi:toxin glutamine deamidase domain-containing protein [Micromonospora sp. R77]|uniref:toxin glutamine deamidase domain-containing protein n=1 Tax=Micromonospora sp. R77 TaxID=2925836 RepID=UPI001F61906B|nr:toxin glutamine deamidase domain-containing protein [Micromonospora sp. R77]MCI4064402.1 toxin glutamine deamidase domain-containing protein [Micromonospora sp. R77]
MSLLPSPIPHPLDHCPWDVPGWIYEALDWVVGVEWPDGNECAVWDLADRWYAVADVLTGPRDDATGAASEVRSGYGGVGAVAAAFDTAWRRVAEGDDAPLPALFAITGELGRLVESCGCDIEGAKLEVWIELGILVVELLSVAVATVLTAGAASPAAGVAITTTRMVVQQIFKRLMAQLARKAIKEGLKEAGERAAKQVVKSGVRGLARRAALGGLAEAGEEAGISLATQAYQNSTGRRHGLDLTDVGTSAVGGFAGGAVAPLAGLGRHADGRLGRIGEHFGREMTGETIAEGAAGLATGQGVSLEDLARAAVSGASGSATGQADAALHHRLDGRLAALAGAAPPALDLTALSSPVAGPLSEASGAVDQVPAQRTSDQVIEPGVGGADRTAAEVGSARPDATDGALVGPRSQVHGIAGQPTAGSSASDLTAVHQAFAAPQTADNSFAVPESVHQALAGAEAGPPAVGPAVDRGVGASVTGAGTSSVVAPVSPTLSSVAVESPPVPVPGLSSIGSGPTLDPVTSPVTAQASAAPAVLGGPALPTPLPTTSGTQPSVDGPGSPSGPAVSSRTIPAALDGSSRVVPPTVPAVSSRGASPAAPDVSSRAVPPAVPDAAHRLAAPATTAPSPGPTAPAPEHTGTGSDGRPRPSPRFPLLEALAPGPARPTNEPLPDPPYPFHRPPHRPGTPDRQAALTADREGLDRRRYRGYFEAQRQWFEDKRRHDEAEWLRERAAYHEEQAVDSAAQAEQLRREGRDLAAERFRRQAFEASQESYDLRDRMRAVRDGAIAPAQVMVDDDADFHRINDDVADLAVGGVETSDRSALTGDDDPPPIDRSRRYGVRGGLRPPLALHQRDLERQMPRAADGAVLRTPDPRVGGWFRLANDGGPQADPTRGINCLDCTLSLYETWMHGRPRVSAPRTFDGYLEGDVRRPVSGEQDGPLRVEAGTGGRFQALCGPAGATTYAELRRNVERGYHDLHRQLLTGGHGSYAFLVNSWEGGGSHAWVALNQNGTVLYLDPQSGTVQDRPLYGNTGRPGRGNVIAVDALVLGPDGRPMPLPGRPRGAFSVLPDPPPPHPDRGEPPDFNRVHLLGEPGPGGPAPSTEPEHIQQARSARLARLGAHSDRVSAMLTVRDVLAGSTDLDQVFAAGVTPAELVHHLDPATLRGLAPQLDDAAARDVARLLGDPRVRRMLDQTWEAPPRDEPLLAEALVRQLTQRPELARMILATPELASSLTARPLTLHHLASHQQAIDVLGEVLADIADRGPEAVAADGGAVQATPLTVDQRRVSDSCRIPSLQPRQPGFDLARRNDPSYRRQYLDHLYAQAALAQVDISSLADRLAENSARGAVAESRPEAKDRQRAEDKVNKYRGDAALLTDLAAAKVAFDNLSDLYAALDAIHRDPDVEIAYFEDRFLAPQASGYRDVLMMLRMESGHIAELRLHLKAIDEVASWEHALYEVRRDLKTMADQGDRKISTTEQAIRNGLLRREQFHFWEALRSALRGGPQA